MRYLAALVSRLMLTALVALPLVAGTAVGAPTDPVTVTLPPVGQGDAFVPGVRLVEELPGGYVEEEYFVSGSATLYNYGHQPPLGPTDIVPAQTNVPYKTRIIVRRPQGLGVFNGTVVVEWWNSTAGFDTAPVWDTSAEYFTRNGVVYVGVTNSITSLAFLNTGCRLLGFLPPSCGTRYATLSLPENGLAFEMVSQIANLLKSNSPQNPLPASFDVERLYHAGQSQQGGSVITYASAFHFPVNDGYFVQQGAIARDLNRDSTTLPDCADPGPPLPPPFPGCTPNLGFPDFRVRTDLPVPVVHAVTETDIQILFSTIGRQADTSTFRYYEIAGGGHLTVHEDVEIIPAGVFTPNPIFLEDLCLNPINSTADGPVFVSYVFNALWENLEQQVKSGVAPPPGVLMDVVAGVVQRDAFGNGLGGVRLPSITVPVATYTPGNVADPALPPLLQFIGNLACFLASSVTPFDQATLDTLYPNHGAYVVPVGEDSQALKDAGFLLQKDRQKIVTDAVLSPIGCGIGFELVLVMPPLMWLYGRRQRRRV